MLMHPYGSARPRPSGLTEIMVPAAGTSEEVMIRMKRGRTVTLQVVGPNGEKLPWVEADWEGNYAAHDWAGHRPRRFPDGKVMVAGLDPGGATRVFMVHQPAPLAAVFTVTPKTESRPIEVRLAPTATVVLLQWGRGLSTAETSLAMSVISLEMLASMGPRPFDRGNQGEAIEHGFLHHPLQWGRGLSTAETATITSYAALFSRTLQWGRGLSTAETGP